MSADFSKYLLFFNFLDTCKKNSRQTSNEKIYSKVSFLLVIFKYLILKRTYISLDKESD